MQYILYSRPYDFVRGEFTKMNGEVVPRKVFKCGARAIYYHKKFTDRRYRRSFPDWDDELALLKCKSIKRAKEEQEALKNYCGETFEIYEYAKGRVGRKIETT